MFKRRKQPKIPRTYGDYLPSRWQRILQRLTRAKPAAPGADQTHQ